MLITLNHLKSSLQAVKTYINNVLPKKVSDLVDDSGHYTKPSDGIPASDLADGVISVEDVQVDGTSILDAQGVANIPKIANNALGLVMGGGRATYLDSAGRLCVNTPTSANIKAGVESQKVIAVYQQHESTFYGLAKAAGDTTQSASSNAVGTYTDEAKAAIKSMLDVRDGDLSVGTVTTLPSTENAAAEITGDYTAMTLNLGLPRGKSGVYIGTEAPTDQDISVWIDTSESSNPYVETLTGTDVTIVGSPNCRYMCGELYSLAITPPTAGTMDVMFTSGSTPTVLTVPSTVKFPEWCDPANLEANTIYEIYIMDGSFAGVSTWPV